MWQKFEDMLQFEYDPKFIKLLAKEVVKEMQRVSKEDLVDNAILTSKEAAEYLGISSDYLRKIKHKLPYEKQGDNSQGRLMFRREGLLEAYLQSGNHNKK